MAITPQTVLRLIKVPLEIDNKNQLTFNSEKEQRDYFLSLPHIEIADISYQRKDSVIYFPDHIDRIIEYNYVMYLNENYTNKWFYAFITNMEYETDYNTRISIATDVFQTWQFNINFKESFIEREMIDTADDVPGANLLPEGLETGEFKVGGTADFDELFPLAVIAYTRNPKEDGLPAEVPPSSQGIIINGIPNGMFFWVTSFDYLQGALDSINGKGHGDAIMTVFTIPAFALIGFNGWTLEDIKNGVSYWIVSDFKANPQTKTLLSTPNDLDGYIPKNQKLRTYPYCYLGYNPANGSSKIYRYENFPDGTPVFKMYSEVSQNPTVCFIPQNYRGQTGDALSDMATLQGYPTIGWITEYFNTWLAQNSEIISLQMGQEQFNYETGFIQTALNQTSQMISQGMKGDLGALTTGANLGIELARQDVNHEYYIKNQLAQVEKQAMLPNTATLSGSNSTLLGYNLMDNNIFTRYTIKKQFAERIDKFFDMYGYLTNTVKIPNLKNRPNWNYIKTIGANIIGNIPQTDLQTIKNMFDSGITLWHNKDTFLDYSQNNR